MRCCLDDGALLAACTGSGLLGAYRSNILSIEDAYEAARHYRCNGIAGIMFGDFTDGVCMSLFVRRYGLLKIALLSYLS